MPRFPLIIPFLILSSQLSIRAESEEPKIEQVIENLLTRQAYRRYGDESILEVARSTSSQFNVEGEDADGSIGVRQTLPTGTTIEPGLFGIQPNPPAI